MGIDKFQAAKAQIAVTLNELEQEIFKQVDLSRLLEEMREQWSLPKTMTGPGFTKKLVSARILRAHSFPFPARPETRYAKLDVPMLTVLQSLKPDSYYTHATAIRAHGLAKTHASDIYINFEQQDHQRSELPEQSRIDAAFKNNPRKTNNIIARSNGDIVMLNGMNTGLMGVEERHVKGIDKKPATIRVTDLERTLIDIAVRPYYAYGISGVLDAYDRARSNVDTEKLAKYLHDLEYVYPYHQAIGWYMETAGYSDAQIQPLRTFPISRRFYLMHKMGSSVLNESWSVYVPLNLSEQIPAAQ